MQLVLCLVIKLFGFAAPIIVLILRLLQGLALGGEYGGAATYVAEHAPRQPKRIILLPGYRQPQHLVLFLSLGIILITRHSLDADRVKSIAKFNEWGWRIPFLVSIFLVIVSVYIRLRMKESPLYAKLKTEGKTSVNPLKESFARRSNLKMVLLALFGATMGQGVVWYTGQFYAQSFIENICKVDFEQSRTILIWAILFATPFLLYSETGVIKLEENGSCLQACCWLLLRIAHYLGNYFPLQTTRNKTEVLDKKQINTAIKPISQYREFIKNHRN